MASNIKVSICCVTYNHEDYIEKCLNGFLSQKVNFDLEIIVHDDASTDRTKSIILNYVKKYPAQLKAIFQEKNQYKGKNINPLWTYVIPITKGKYIALCEGDDYWIDPYKLQKQVDLLESTKSEFCYSDFDIYYNNTKTFDKNIFKNNKAFIDIESPLLSFGPMSTASWVISSEFLKSFNPNKYNIDDKAVLILIEFLRLNGKIIFLQDSTSVYRKWIGSNSNQGDAYKRYLHHKTAFEFMLDNFQSFYKNDIKSRLKVFSLGINLLSEAHDHNDYDLIEKIKILLEQSGISITQIMNKFNERNRYKQNYESLANSKLRKLTNKLKFKKG